jgi:hypothetical protein
MTDTDKTGARFGEEERLRDAPATADRGHTERFTDQETALLRQLRFGRLPDPVPRAEWVEALDTDTQFELPDERPAPPHLG